jgi:rubrerythrin
MDKNFPIDSLLIADKNAILIAARSSGYGSAYETTLNCPACGHKNEDVFDLSEPHIYEGEGSEDIQMTENGTYKIVLPITKVNIEFRLLTSKDERKIVKKLTSSESKSNQGAGTVTDQYKLMVVSANGVTDSFQLAEFIERMPVTDSKTLRDAYKEVAPAVQIKKHFECNSCGHEQELEVPFGADFFWPKQ